MISKNKGPQPTNCNARMLVAIQEYLQERNSYQPYGIKLWDKVNFDIQPTNPQAEIVATGRCKYWITDTDLMKHQGNDTESPSDDPILPEVYTATVACIYIADGKCKGMLTPERFGILQRAFERAKYSDLHDNIHPPPSSHAAHQTVNAVREHGDKRHTESYIRTRRPHHTQIKILLPPNIQARRIKTHFHGCFPPTLSPPYKNGP